MPIPIGTTINSIIASIGNGSFTAAKIAANSLENSVTTMELQFLRHPLHKTKHPRQHNHKTQHRKRMTLNIAGFTAFDGSH